MKPQLHYGEDDCPISAPDGFPKDDELHFEIELIEFFKAKVMTRSLNFIFYYFCLRPLSFFIQMNFGFRHTLVYVPIIDLVFKTDLIDILFIQQQPLPSLILSIEVLIFRFIRIYWD